MTFPGSHRLVRPDACRIAATLALLCLVLGALAGAAPDADTSWDGDGLALASLPVILTPTPPAESSPLAEAAPDASPKHPFPVFPRPLRAPPLRDVS